MNVADLLPGTQDGRGATMGIDVAQRQAEPRRDIAASVEQLLGPDVVRESLASQDGKSGAVVERVTIDGERYVLKHLHLEHDWVMRATGDVAGRPLSLWRSGWLDELPDCLDHAIVGAAWDERSEGRGGAILMHDVGDQLVSEGDHKLPLAQHLVFPLLDDPTPLVRALSATPQTLVHGDWKAGNLGSYADGQTILIDWALPGVAPPCVDVAWYLCLNRARLPQDKEATLIGYREALERHGVDTEGWWERQSSLCLLGLVLLFGWEKALGDGDEVADELAWWEARAVEAAKELSR